MPGFVYRPSDENDAASPDVYWHRHAQQRAAAMAQHAAAASTIPSLSTAFQANDEQRASEVQTPQESPWLADMPLPPNDPAVIEAKRKMINKE